ncbi:hypothetical protein N0V82_000781 [Gnomoniopsis sp. IMI 355080]|nr:hypothetical protein N0V82_000781 [Gnomoniopsis sp. IMI 355080]
MGSGSGSGGFYKYRCKYFYTHNCSNWVYVSNAPCASCLAEGRDDNTNMPAQAGNSPPREVKVPYLDQDGVLQYSLMEIIHVDQSGLYWQLRQQVTQPHMPMIPTTSDQPRAVFAASSGMPQQAHA